MQALDVLSGDLSLTDRISEIVKGALPASAGAVAPPRDADLFRCGLTSMGLVKLMLAIEAALDVSVPDAELSPDNFRSIDAIEALVNRLRAV